MLQQVRLRLPALSPFAEWVYGHHSRLLYEDEVIWSQTGPQQGCPLGSVLFALGLQPLIERIEAECGENLLHPAGNALVRRPIDLNAWFLDDGTLCGRLDKLAKALEILQTEGPGIGLQLSLSKSVLWKPPGAQAPVELPGSLGQLTMSVEGGVPLLGGPVGSPTFCQQTVKERVTTLTDMLNALSTLDDSQVEYHLLRSCFGFPKFTCTSHVHVIQRTASPCFRNSTRHSVELWPTSLGFH